MFTCNEYIWSTEAGKLLLFDVTVFAMLPVKGFFVGKNLVLDLM